MDPEGESPAVIGGVGVGVIVAGGAAIAGTICMMTPGCREAVVEWTKDIVKDISNLYCSEHTKNARPSTKGQHEKGEARKTQDRPGGEKGDVNRRPGRKPPPGYNGSWPPK